MTLEGKRGRYLPSVSIKTIFLIANVPSLTNILMRLQWYWRLKQSLLHHNIWCECGGLAKALPLEIQNSRRWTMIQRKSTGGLCTVVGHGGWCLITKRPRNSNIINGQLDQNMSEASNTSHRRGAGSREVVTYRVCISFRCDSD